MLRDPVALPVVPARPNGRQSVGELAGCPSPPAVYAESPALTTKNAVPRLDQSDIQDSYCTIRISRERPLIWLWLCNAVSPWRLR